MKNISIEHAHRASQMILGLETQSNMVVMALEAPLELDSPVEWLAYGAGPARAREIANMLLHAADIIEGTAADDGRYSSSIEDFKDHHAH